MKAIRFLIAAVAALVMHNAWSAKADDDLVNYNLNTMRGYGKCTVEMENAPMEFFHETFDGSHRSGFGIGADGMCTIKVHLSDPVEVHALRMSFFMGRDLGGVVWRLSALDKDGKTGKTILEHKTTVLGKPDEAKLDKPTKLKDFALTFTKLLSDMSEAPKGKMDFRIGEIEILVANQPILYVATPDEKWLFEPGFYPFETVPGREIDWTGWAITADGKRDRTTESVKFSSSNPRLRGWTAPL